jgi:hypothetical protein
LSVPDGTEIEIMLRRNGSGDIFAREHVHIVISKTALDLIPVESKSDPH